MVGMQMTVYNSIIICVPTARQYKPYFSSETQYMATILKFPLHLNISIFIIIILATLPTSNGSDNTYEGCTSLISCGMLQNVGYPFWGLGRPRYCGHPELQLHCPLNESNVYPFLKLRKHGVRYHVLSIHNNSTSLKMTIQVQELSNTNNSCPFHQTNTIFEEIFQSSENVEHMNLFYNCSNKSLLDVYHGQITRLHHTNLVKLYGCTTDHSQELLLVYGLIPNGTVADHLYGDRKGFGNLSWDKRMKIAIETASVLSYLHASDIIHHDVKTNNILLDNDFSVKVADLGLSRLFPSDTIHVSTNPQGTPGYIDPDYNKSYQVTNKSDVYSFGVVLVELISSLPALDINRQNDEINLSDYAMKRIQHGTLGELVDQKLGFKTNLKVKKMITSVAELAFRCLQQDKELRPSMDEVLDVLKQIESMDSKPLKGEDMTHSRETSKPIFTPRKKANLSRFPPSPNSVIESWASRSCESNISA